MKITLVGAFPPQKKGEAHYLGRYAHALREVHDLHLDVVSQYVDEPAVEEHDGFKVHRAIRDRSKSSVSYAAQSEMVDAVTATGCEIMHLHYGPGPDYGGRLGESLCKALRTIQARDIKTVLTLHSVWLPDDVRDQARQLQVPRVAHPLIVGYFGRFMRSLRGALDAELLLVSAENSPMRRAFEDAYGVHDLDEEVHGCEPQSVPFVSSSDPEILAFGFLRPDKGFEYLIEAFSRFVQAGGRARLKIVGSPQSEQYAGYGEHLVRLSKDVPFGRCTVDARYVPDEELQGMLAKADVLAVPYLRNVGASGPLHHAISFGKPVICSDAGHNAALRGSLAVFPTGDVAALQSLIGRVVDDTRYREELARNASTIAAARSWERLAERNSQLYRKLVKK